MTYDTAPLSRRLRRAHRPLLIATSLAVLLLAAPTTAHRTSSSLPHQSNRAVDAAHDVAPPGAFSLRLSPDRTVSFVPDTAVDGTSASTPADVLRMARAESAATNPQTPRALAHDDSSIRRSDRDTKAGFSPPTGPPQPTYAEFQLPPVLLCNGTFKNSVAVGAATSGLVVSGGCLDIDCAVPLAAHCIIDPVALSATYVPWRLRTSTHTEHGGHELTGEKQAEPRLATRVGKSASVDVQGLVGNYHTVVTHGKVFLLRSCSEIGELPPLPTNAPSPSPGGSTSSDEGDSSEYHAAQEPSIIPAKSFLERNDATNTDSNKRNETMKRREEAIDFAREVLTVDEMTGDVTLVGRVPLHNGTVLRVNASCVSHGGSVYFAGGYDAFTGAPVPGVDRLTVILTDDVSAKPNSKTPKRSVAVPSFVEGMHLSMTENVLTLPPDCNSERCIKYSDVTVAAFSPGIAVVQQAAPPLPPGDTGKPFLGQHSVIPARPSSKTDANSSTSVLGNTRSRAKGVEMSTASPSSIDGYHPPVKDKTGFSPTTGSNRTTNGSTWRHGNQTMEETAPSVHSMTDSSLVSILLSDPDSDTSDQVLQYVGPPRSVLPTQQRLASAAFSNGLFIGQSPFVDQASAAVPPTQNTWSSLRAFGAMAKWGASMHTVALPSLLRSQLTLFVFGGLDTWNATCIPDSGTSKQLQHQTTHRDSVRLGNRSGSVDMTSNGASTQRRVPCKASDILQLVELDYGVPKVAFGPHQTRQHGVVQAPFVVSMSVRPVKDGWLKLSDSVDCSTTLAPIVEWPAHARDVTFLPNATSDNAYVCFSTGLEIVEVPAGNSGAEKARDVFFFAACNPLMPIVFKPATPEPTPEPSPNPTPSPTPNPTPNPTPEPSPSPTPEPTPSPTHAPATPTPTTPMPTAAPTPAPSPNDSAPSSAAIAGYTAAGIAGVLIIVVVVTCVLRPAWWRTAAQEVSVRLARIGMGGGGSDAHGGDEAFTALSAAQLRVVRRIGSGAWGVVYLCERVRDGTQLAVKHIPCTQVEARVLALREIATLQSVQGHPNVVAVHEMLIREFWVDDNQADSAFGSHGRDSAASRPQQQGRARAYSAKPNGGRRMPIGSEEFSTWTGHTSSALETTILNNTAVANGSSGAITMTLDPKVQMSRAHSNILDGADTLDHQHSNGHSSPSATRRRQHLSNGHGSPARNRGHQKTPKSSPPPQGGTRSNGHDTPLLGETTPPVPVREAADIDAPIVAAASGSEKDRKNHTAVAVNGSHDVLKESPSSARQLKDSAEVSQRRLRRGVNATDSDSASARSAGSDNDDDTAVVAVDASANLVSGVNVDEKSGSEESFGETAVREHQDAVHDGRPTVRRFLCIVMRYYPQGDIMHWLKAVFPVSPQATQHESLASDSDFFAPIRISCQDRAKVGSLLPEQLLFAMTVQLSGVLAYLHRRGILHCDIKPENILVADRIPPFYLNNTATTGNAGSTVPPVAASPSSSPAARPEQPRSPQSAPGAAQGQQFDSDPLQPTPGIGDDRKASSLNGGGDGVQSPEGSPRVPPRANTDVPDTNQGGAGPGRGERERSFSRVTQDGSFASDTRSPCAPDVPASPAADPNASSTTEIAGDCSNTRTQVAADAGLTAPAASTVGNRSFAQSVTALKKEKPLTPASCHQVRDYFVPIVVADFGVAQVMQRSGRAIKSTVRNRDAFLSKDAAPAKSRAKSNEGVVAGRQRSNSAAPRRSSMGGGDHRQQQQQHQQQQPHLARRGSIDDGDESELRTEPRDSNRPQRRSTATATAAAGSRSCGASPSCGVARAPAAAAGGGENKNRRMSHSRTSLHDVDFSDPEADDDDNGRHHNYDDDEDDDDDDDPTGPLGFSLPYLSPECVANNMSSFSSKNDVWAMGCVIHALATKRVLFPDLSRTYLFEHARRQTFRADVAVSITCLGYSDAFAALVVGMLEPDPAKRLSAAQVHSHFSTVAPLRYAMRNKG